MGVIMPGAVTGIVTGIMLAVARIAGETAPLIFTALGSAFGVQGLDQADRGAAFTDIPLCAVSIQRLAEAGLGRGFPAGGTGSRHKYHCAAGQQQEKGKCCKSKLKEI